jgi:hypothetical protein
MNPAMLLASYRYIPLPASDSKVEIVLGHNLKSRECQSAHNANQFAEGQPYSAPQVRPETFCHIAASGAAAFLVLQLPNS